MRLREGVLRLFRLIKDLEFLQYILIWKFIIQIIFEVAGISDVWLQTVIRSRTDVAYQTEWLISLPNLRTHSLGSRILQDGLQRIEGSWTEGPWTERYGIEGSSTFWTLWRQFAKCPNHGRHLPVVFDILLDVMDHRSEPSRESRNFPLLGHHLLCDFIECLHSFDCGICQNYQTGKNSFDCLYDNGHHFCHFGYNCPSLQRQGWLPT